MVLALIADDQVSFWVLHFDPWVTLLDTPINQHKALCKTGGYNEDIPELLNDVWAGKT